MIELDKCKEMLSRDEISDGYFVNLHVNVEGYLKRLVFIGLRVQGVQYKTAQDAITKYHESVPNVIKKAWKLLNVDYNNDLLKFGKYKILEDYMVHFTSKYRNYRVHGVYDEIRDSKLLEVLIKIDKAFIAETECYLAATGRPSAFDVPREWGAKRSGKMPIEEVFHTLLGDGNLKKQKYTKTDALNMVQEQGI